MAKRKSKPVVAIKADVISPTVESVPSAPSDPDTEDCYLYNEDTGELRMVRMRAGYAPTPMPFGFRLARAEEIPGK